MPIYAYRCSACGHAKDVLQKMSDPVLVTCPACGADAFAKQVTAAGFQLKGSGWYVTDFRGGASGKGGDADKAPDAPVGTSGDKSGDKASDKSADKGADKGASCGDKAKAGAPASPSTAAPAASPAPTAPKPAASPPSGAA